MSLDLAFVRSQFPALADGFAYFDNAGGSLVLRNVAERISDYLLTTSVQTGASYEHSQAGLRAGFMEARAKIARLLNAEPPGGDRAGTLDHRPRASSSPAPWKAASSPGTRSSSRISTTSRISAHGAALEKRGIVIKEWSIDRDSYEIDLDELDRLMTERTRLVAVTHASNILGTINPIKEIARRVHERGAEIVVDAVAYAPHRAVDVNDLDVDYYIFSFYKTYGPHFAVMYGKYEKLLELDGLYHYFYGRDKVPMKLEPGNTNYELAWGSAGIVDYLDALGGGTGDRAAIDRAFGKIAGARDSVWAKSSSPI